MRIRKPEEIRIAKLEFGICALGALLLASTLHGLDQGARPPVLAQIDRTIRQGFFDPDLKGVDWSGAVERASAELAQAASQAERDAAYDRLLATLSDSHTFRVPAGRLPERHWGTAGLRIGRDGDGYAVKGVIPGGAADRAGLAVGDRVLEVDGKQYGPERVNFRDLFFVFEGAPGSSVAVTWQRAGAPPRTDRLVRTAEEPGDTLVWKSARVLRRGSGTYGYARLWGMSADTALAIVDMLLDREETARVRPQLSGWGDIAGFLLDVRGNSGGYDPNILTTFLRGLWSAGDYYLISREGKRLAPPVYRPLPVALLVNSGTASSGEALALKFRAHAIGPIVGETTAGMASGGAAAEKLSDGSMLWYSARAIEGLDGRSYEGRGVAPDVTVADRPPARPGEEDAIIEAGLKALETAAVSSR
jgi:C-terminal processing protease CtpA/Prc